MDKESLWYYAVKLEGKLYDRFRSLFQQVGKRKLSRDLGYTSTSSQSANNMMNTILKKRTMNAYSFLLLLKKLEIHPQTIKDKVKIYRRGRNRLQIKSETLDDIFHLYCDVYDNKS